MTCDECKRDIPDHKLIWTGRYKHFDTLFKIRIREMRVCLNCRVRFGYSTLRNNIMITDQTILNKDKKI